jgi:microcompartment protein CcmK/EutM
MNIQKHDDALATGQVLIQLIDAEGNLKEEHKVKNLVVTAGKGYIANRMQGTSVQNVMGWMAIGIDSTTPVVGQTQLVSEAGRVTLASFTASGSQVTATATFPAGTGTGAIKEAAILNASTGGTMLCRTTFPVVNKAAGDSIAVTWVVTVS